MSATGGLGITEGNILDLVLTNNKFLVRDYPFIRMILILITFLSPSHLLLNPIDQRMCRGKCTATRKRISLGCERLYVTYLGNQLSLTALLKNV